MSAFLHYLELSVPLFALVFVGYALMHWGHWPKAVSEGLSRFVFSVALPALLFRLMADRSKLPPVDARLLLAFFGGCLIVFVIGRIVGARLFRLDGVAGSVFALGGIFSNNVLLGVPLAKVTLGEAALPTVALVVVFNALTLWTLVTISVEWSRHGSLSLHGFGRTLKGVLTNPLVAAILSGTLFGLTGLPLPALIDTPLAMTGQAATPLALIALGMGLAEYGISTGWQQSVGISVLKLIVQPLVVWALARLLGLPAMETQAVVLLASLATGANVYLMSRQFKTMEGPVAASLVLTTALAALTTPLALALVGG
jgi:predicted permease